MNQTHIHLLINHLPVFGSFLGIVVLSFALWRKSKDVRLAAYLVFIIAAGGGLIANYTGDAAKETVKHIDGIDKDSLHEHEQAADFAVIALSAIGLLSLVALYLEKKNSKRSLLVAKIILVVSIWAFSVVARTSYLGGMIRHTEVNTVQAK